MVDVIEEGTTVDHPTMEVVGITVEGRLVEGVIMVVVEDVVVRVVTSFGVCVALNGAVEIVKMSIIVAMLLAMSIKEEKWRK